MAGIALRFWSWQSRLTPWALPVIAFWAVYLPVLVSAVRSYPGWLDVAVGLLAAVAAWRAAPWALLALAAVDTALSPPGLSVAVASYVAATTLKRPAYLVGHVVAASAMAVVPIPGEGLTSALAGAPVLVWLPVVVGLWTDARRQVLSALRERADRLEQQQQVRAEQARAQERARIARDMHDIVAHRVSLMVLRAGALEVNAPDDRTAAEAELIRVTGTEALAQLRTALGVLDRGEDAQFGPQSTLADLDGLLERSRAAGVAVDRHDEGTPGPVPVLVQHTAYLLVQESLTNVGKHVGPVPARLVLRHCPDTLEVIVSNAAPQQATPAGPGSGLGLIGLRERVELLGGTFDAGPDGRGGFTVSATLSTRVKPPT